MFEEKIDQAVELILSKGLVLIGGNGGSAEQANHFEAELIGRFEGFISSFPCVSMTSNTATITAIANDYGYENLFLPHFEAFYKFDPVMIFITTSGFSKNILNAIDMLERIGENDSIILLTGKKVNDKVGIEFNVEENTTYEIQERHMEILHRIALGVKQKIDGELK